MQTTGIFQVHRVEVQVQKLNEPIYLIPFGDVHRSSDMCAVDKWREFLEWAAKKKNCFFMGMGDYDDFASASERLILKDSRLHESTAKDLNDLAYGNVARMVKELSFMKGRIIGLIEGNHYMTFPNGATTTQIMAERLQTRYLGCSTFVRLAFKLGRKHYSLDIWAHHGKGASRLIGGSLNRVQQMGEAAEADIYLMGHDHKKSVGMTTKLSLSTTGSSLTLNHRKQLYIRTGSFLKGYEAGRSTYIADAAMSPTDLGVVKIELTPKREVSSEMDRFYVDMHASI